ncbi:hypothetical protein C2E23DRAFT_736092 [Lenzites betulinus]|nr:hypothetical protein C2E23DRAFT_736092 [Lenzites betulinus]
MTENVPDEILELILYLALVVPSDTFESWGSSTSFAGTPRSTVPHLLLVSKRWHYLGEPALYESAILRTKRQVNALAGAAGKVNGRGIKQGTYLRRLRIEGGYNNRFNQLLAAGPNIHTLFIGFDISLDDSASGLKRGLQRINPSRLYLKATPGGHLTAQNTMSLYAAVAAAFPSWTNLKRIDTSLYFMSAGSIETSLKELSSLEYISTTSFRPFCPDNPSLKTIQIRDGNNWLENWKQYPNQLSRIDREKVVLGEGKNMIRWTDLLQLRADLPEGASKLLDLPDKVWSQILDRVTDIHRNTYPALTVGFFHRPAEVRANTARRNVVLVNKRFHRLGIPYLYTVPYLPSERAVYGFIYRVQSSAVLAAFVREIFVPETLVLSGHSAPITIPMMKNLERVLSFHFPVLLGHAKCLPEGQVSKLEQAHEHHAQAVPFAPRDFLKFPHLRELSLRGGCGAGLDDVHPDVLPQLERLTVINPGPRIFRVFQSMRYVAMSDIAERNQSFRRGRSPSSGGPLCLICAQNGHRADACTRTQLPNGKAAYSTYSRGQLFAVSGGGPLCTSWNASGKTPCDNYRCPGGNAPHVCSFCGATGHHAGSKRCL